MTSATSTATGESGKGILRDFNAPPGRGPRRDACLSAAKHLPDRSRRVRLASASEVTLCGQRLRYLPHGQRPKDAPHQPGFSILRAGGPELVALAEQVERIVIEIDIGGI